MLKSLIRFIRNFFSFSYAEAKGFLAMAGGIAVASIGFLIYNSLPSEGYNSYLQDKAQLDSLVSLIEAREKSVMDRARKAREEKKRSSISIPKREAVYFPFDPNHLSSDSLQLLGMPKWLAERIRKYRQKGGAFRTKNDLLRIYGFSDSLYAKVEPYILIPKAVPPPGKEKPERFSKGVKEGENAAPLIFLDINKADSLQLQQLKGIGPVLSSRIVRFRDKMGGFVSLNQLHEVYGIDSGLVNELLKVIYIGPNFQSKKLAINSASMEKLAAHPYISFTQAGRIYEYKKQHGPFTSVYDLLRIHTFDSIFVNKIAPYIRFD